jgi:hypothetical protein
MRTSPGSIEKSSENTIHEPKNRSLETEDVIKTERKGRSWILDARAVDNTLLLLGGFIRQVVAFEYRERG